MTTEDTLKAHWLATDVRLLDDTYFMAVVPMIFNHRLIHGRITNRDFHFDAWCYDTRAEAVRAMLEFDGKSEPTGWKKHVATGRFRGPDGLIHERGTYKPDWAYL